MRVIAIANQKGGSAKTTTAINLGAALARRGKKVLLIDMDPQANATIGFDVKAHELKNSIYHVLVGPAGVPLDSVIISVGRNLDIAPSDIGLSGAELELANEIGRETRLSHSIHKMKRRYDYVLVDCPPSLGLLTFNCLVAADEVLVPVEMSFFALQGLGKLLQLVEIIRERLDHRIDFRAVATMFDRRNNICKEIFSNLKENFGEKVLDTAINVNVKLKEAASKGVHIFDYDGKSRGAQDYEALAREIMAHEKQPKQQENRRVAQTAAA